MKCAGCMRDLAIGDQYIKAPASEFAQAAGLPPMADVDGLMADIMGCGSGGDIIYCENCTKRGGDFMLETVYGDEGQ